VDVVALGNLCVDILLPHGPIPPPGQVKSEAMLTQLTAGADSHPHLSSTLFVVVTDSVTPSSSSYKNSANGEL
jgi:hypothetical protein